MLTSVVRLSEISRDQWIRWRWLDVTQMDDVERRFLQGHERTPDEARRALHEWRVFEQVRQKAR